MVGENFRSWLEAWEKSGWLTRVPKAVDPKYVLGAITKKLGKEKAVFFEQVSGYAIPLVTNFFFSRKALATALSMEEKNLIPSFRAAMEKPRACEIIGECSFPGKCAHQKFQPP